MSGSILERLEARLSAKPAVVSIETLFPDLEEAHAEITALNAKIKAMTTAQDQTPSAALAGGASGGPVGPVIAPHITPGTVAHVHTLLNDAKERLSVNALGTVASHIESAIKLIESEL